VQFIKHALMSFWKTIKIARVRRLQFEVFEKLTSVCFSKLHEKPYYYPYKHDDRITLLELMQFLEVYSVNPSDWFIFVTWSLLYSLVYRLILFSQFTLLTSRRRKDVRSKCRLLIFFLLVPGHIKIRINV
jgi:hypothetical protein